MTGWRIFRLPLALGAISLSGLVAALLTDGPIDMLWTVLIAVPVVTAVVRLIR